MNSPEMMVNELGSCPRVLPHTIRRRSWALLMHVSRELLRIWRLTSVLHQLRCRCRVGVVLRELRRQLPYDVNNRHDHLFDLFL